MATKKKAVSATAQTETKTAEPKGKMTGEKKAETKAIVVPHLKAGALSKDLGPVIVQGLAKAFDTEIAATAAIKQVEGKRYELLSQTVLGIVKAAKADKSIDLSIAFSDDKSKKAFLNDQACLALGIKEIVSVGKGEKAVERCAWAGKVASFFPQRGDDKDSEETKRKATFRANFVTTLGKCLKTAAGIVDNDVKAEMDKQAGTLRLSGPTIKKQFGQPSVLLNEKQTVVKGGENVKLAEKPSFTAIAAKAAEAHGATVHRGSNTRGAQIQTDPNKAVVSVCSSLVQAIGKLSDEPTKEVRAALESVANAVDEYLG